MRPQSTHLAKFYLEDVRALTEHHPAVLLDGLSAPVGADIELGDLARLCQKRRPGGLEGHVIHLRGGHAPEGGRVALYAEGGVVHGVVEVVVVDEFELNTDVIHDIGLFIRPVVILSLIKRNESIRR